MKYVTRRQNLKVIPLNQTFRYFISTATQDTIFCTSVPHKFKRDKVTGEWRKPHNEELNDLYSSPSIVRFKKSRRMKLEGRVVRLGEKRGVYMFLVGKPECKRPFGGPIRK